MKRKFFSGLVGLATMTAGLVLVATPASAATCGIYDAWDNSGGQSSTQLSDKGCDSYHGRAKITVYGNVTWSAFGTAKAPSPALIHVWTTSKINSAASGVLGSHTEWRYASAPWQNGGQLTH